MKGLLSAAVLIGLALASPVRASAQESGFLEDYSGLQQQGSSGTRVWITPNVNERLADFDAIMIEQPEILIAADSKYQGMKPDDMKLIADTMRALLVKRIERSEFRLVTTPGPGTLYLRTGLTNLHVAKKRMRLIQFTPAGLALTVATAPLRDIMDKLNIQEVTIEAEVLDSQSSERFGAFVEEEFSEQKKDAKWDALLELMGKAADRLSCRLSNSHLPTESGRDCVKEIPF